MGVIKIDIDSDAVVKFTGKLERIHRSALPNVIRTTLNSAAFDVKKNTMPDETKRTFVNRNKTFFSANSRVQMAKGFDIKTMHSTVGFINGESNQAIRDLESQERGGSIGGRSFVPLKGARESGDYNKKVENKYRTTKFKNVVRASREKGNKGQRIIKAAFKAGRGGNIISQNGIVFRVVGLKKKGEKIKLKAIYSFRKGRTPKIKATHFMQKSSTKSSQKIDQFYIKEAKKRLVK